MHPRRTACCEHLLTRTLILNDQRPRRRVASESGQQVIGGRYELTSPISTGGMGQVWRGYDTVLDRDIAVKLIRPDLTRDENTRAQLISRFRREARVTAKIEYSGVPAVYDAAFDTSADRLYLVMQPVHGVSLSDMLAERGAQDVEWAASVAAQGCAALSYAHAVPIVHRDLKPSNILISTDGVIKVVDFGVAAVLGTDVTQLTDTGDIVGSKPYMSPEQIRNTVISPAPTSTRWVAYCTRWWQAPHRSPLPTTSGWCTNTWKTRRHRCASYAPTCRRRWNSSCSPCSRNSRMIDRAVRGTCTNNSCRSCPWPREPRARGAQPSPTPRGRIGTRWRCAHQR